MLLECCRCGAPLDVKGTERIVTCRYCKAQTERRELRTLAPETPRDFSPPRTWRPPANMRAPSDVEYAYAEASSNRAAFVLASLPFLLVLAFAGYRIAKRFVGDPTAMPLQQLLEADLRGKPADVAKRLGGELETTAVSVSVSSRAFESVRFSWNDATTEQPNHLLLRRRGEATLPPGTCARLEAALGKPNSGSWTFPDLAHVACDEPNGSLRGGLSGGEAERGGPERANAAFDVLRRLVLGAALGRDDTVTTDAMKKALGIGYSWAELAAVDVTADFDSAPAMFERVLPGAGRDQGTAYSVFTSHAVLRQVRFSFENKARGKLTGIHVSDLGSSDFGQERQAAIAGCLTRTLGKPEIRETNHAANERAYVFEHRREGNVWLSKGSLHANAPTANFWGAITDALKNCP
jgi:hypothetical protein